MDFGALTAGGWAAGLNLWSAILVLGVSGRMDWAQTPEILQRTDILVAAAVLYALEFVVDKIPYVDNAWDVASTIIRPVGGTLLGIAVAAEGGGSLLAGAATAGGLALTSHAAKATTRAAINMSPEPFSNIVASLTEDAASVGIISLGLAYPAFTVGVVGILAIAALLVTFSLWRFVRRLRRRWGSGFGTPRQA